MRRGHFIAGLGGVQFAQPGADQRLRVKAEDKPAQLLAATDPANPYGAAPPWPAGDARQQRAPGALVVLHQGRLLGYLSMPPSTVQPVPGPRGLVVLVCQPVMSTPVSMRSKHSV